MVSLYARLGKLGFSKKFVREFLLPDWWDDAAAESPSGYAQACISIARTVDMPFQSLFSPDAKLALPSPNQFRLKKRSDTKPDALLPAVVLAQVAARIVANSLIDLPAYSPAAVPAAIRATILDANQNVDLAGLLDWSWQHGIIVLPMSAFPAGIKKFTALAMFADQRPVVVLASGRDGPPWHAFHLAHELGHILLGHVSPGKPPLVDEKIRSQQKLDDPTFDPEESAADEFALLLLTSQPALDFDAEVGLTAPKLADRAQNWQRERGVNAGTIALTYGNSAARMPVAQDALKLLGLMEGAHAAARLRLTRHLPDELSESLEAALRLMGFLQHDLDALEPTFSLPPSA